MTTERIDIVVREDGSRVVKRNLEEIGNVSDRTADSLGLLKTALLGITAAFSFSKFAEYTSLWTDLNARVNRFAGSARGTETIMNRLMVIAQRTYAPLEGIAEIYLESAFSLEQLGKSTQETLDFTEALTNALVVSGAKGERQAAVINAISKAMLEGKLAGDNWQTVLTQGGRVVEALVQETGKSLTELKAMASAGDLTSDTLFTALTSQLEKLQEEADAMPATINDAFVRMQNRILQTVGQLDKKLGASTFIVKFIDLITTNLETLIPIFVGVGAAIAVAFAPMIIMQFAGAIQALWILMLANPFVAVAAIVAGLITTLYLLRDSIKLGIDDTTTLGDLMRAVWETIGPMIETVAEVAKNVFGFITEELKKSTTLWTGITFDGVEDQSEGWLGLVRTVAQVFDMIGAVVRGAALAIGRTIGTAVAASVEQLRLLGKAAIAAFTGNFEELPGVMEQILGNTKNAWSTIGDVWGESINESLQAQVGGGLEAALDSLLARAREIGKARAAANGTGDGLPTNSIKPPGPPVDADAAKKAAKELERLKAALRGIMDEADPVGAATRRLAEAQDVLTRSVKAGLIEQAKADAIYSTLRENMEAQLDPLGALNKVLDKNIELLKMSSVQRQIEADLYQMTEQLKRDGIILTQEETGALRAKLVVEQQLAAISGKKDQLQQNSSGARAQDFDTTIAAIQELVADKDSGFGLVDGFNAANEAMGGLLTNTTSGIEAQLTATRAMYAEIDILRQKGIIDEQTAAEAKQAIWSQQAQSMMNTTADALGVVAGLMQSNNKTAFRVGKAAAIAQATMTSISTAMNVYESASKIPYVGWILGPVAAAAALATGAMNVSKIRSQQMPGFRSGGEYMVGGYGGVDSQQVAFRASPGERISVNTPAQARALEKMGEKDSSERGGRRFNQTVNVVVQGKPDRQTPRQTARAIRRESTAEFFN